MSRAKANGTGVVALYIPSEGAIAELLARREFWFQRFLNAKSARALNRAREGIARCESLIVRIETVHLRASALLPMSSPESEVESASAGAAMPPPPRIERSLSDSR